MVVHPLSHRPNIYVLLLAGELARVAGEPLPHVKVVSNEQEEAGSRCRVVEGIEAEVEDIIFGAKKVSKLSKLSFKLLSNYAYGGCTSGPPARRLHLQLPALFANACSTD